MARRIGVVGLCAALAATALVGGGAASAKTSTQPARAAIPRSAEQLPTAPLSSAAVPSGYTLVSATFMATNGVQTLGRVDCPPTRSGAVRQPQGGGVYSFSGSLGVNINGSYPNGTGWVAYVNNNSGSNTTFAVFAVCAKPKTGYTMVEVSGIPNPAGSQSSGFVACPAGTRVLGGGGLSVSGDLAANINDSYPTANGWHADVNNGSGSATTFNVYAVCSRYSLTRGYMVVAGAAVDNPPGSQGLADAICPTGYSPLGGGASSSTSSTSVNMNTTNPFTNGWQVYENNGSGGDASLTPYVICAT